MVKELAVIQDMPYTPQGWQYNEHSKDKAYIDPEIIISYDPKNGMPVSYYTDDVWRLTWSINARKRRIIDYTLIENSQDKELIKRLMFLIIQTSRGKKNSIKSPSTLGGIYGVLLPLHRYAVKHNTLIEAILRNKLAMRRYITKDIKFNKGRGYHFMSLLTFLSKRQEDWAGIVYKTDSEHFRILAKYNKEYQDSLNQTECIPPRILRNAQRMRWEHIEAAWKVRTKLIVMIERLITEPSQYRTTKYKATRTAYTKGLPVPNHFFLFSQLADELGLNSICNTYSINGRRRLIYYLNALSKTCRHLIYGYTGMRNDEGCTLWVGCYKDKGAGRNPVIYGIESKNGIPIKHPFVTIKEIKKVIDLQTAITKAIAKYSHPDTKEYPLFFSPRWITNGKVEYMGNKIAFASNELPLDESQLIITEEDIKKTLQATEPDRDWKHDPNYQVGMIWKFKWHQYRRSIAVYSLRSGLVNISALGNQYRHLFEATTAHYGNGRFVAEPLSGTDSQFHVKYEIDQIRDQYDSRALWRDVLVNLERPYSGFAPIDIGDESIDPSDQIEDINGVQTIAAKMKRGEIGHTNTAIGSCKSLTPCDGHMMLIWRPCLECAEKVPNEFKIDILIEEQTHLVEKLDATMPGSIEVRDQKDDLTALIEFRDTLRKKNG
jgi:hypothetical protein